MRSLENGGQLHQIHLASHCGTFRWSRRTETWCRRKDMTRYAARLPLEPVNTRRNCTDVGVAGRLRFLFHRGLPSSTMFPFPSAENSAETFLLSTLLGHTTIGTRTALRRYHSPPCGREIASSEGEEYKACGERNFLSQHLYIHLQLSSPCSCLTYLTP
nr:hypothetical protein CFP56_20475 [Quercus suber]